MGLFGGVHFAGKKQSLFLFSDDNFYKDVVAL